MEKTQNKKSNKSLEKDKVDKKNEKDKNEAGIIPIQPKIKHFFG